MRARVPIRPEGEVRQEREVGLGLRRVPRPVALPQPAELLPVASGERTLEKLLVVEVDGLRRGRRARSRPGFGRYSASTASSSVLPLLDRLRRAPDVLAGAVEEPSRLEHADALRGADPPFRSP